MKNKIITILICIMLSCFCVFALTACGSNENQDQHSHEYKCEVVEATCIRQGKKIYSCSCGSSIFERVEPLGHDFSNYVYNNDAKYLVDGTETAICNRVNCEVVDTKIKIGSALSHLFTNYVSDNNATVDKDGTKTAVCDIEGCFEVNTINDVGSKLTATEGLNYILDTDKDSVLVSGIGNATETDIVIPSRYNGYPVTAIYPSAFINCASITSVVIPDSVTNIGFSAFKNCKSLKSVIMGNGVTRLGDMSFEGCDSLVNLQLSQSITNIGSFSFSGCNSLNYNIKSNLKYLGSDENPYFYLVGVVLTSAMTVEIDSKCKFIGEFAFLASSIVNVKIPDGVMKIESNAFYNCPYLSVVWISNNISIIDSYAFFRCPSLKSIIFEGYAVEWKDVEKRAYWNYEIGATKIVCNDGEVNI